MSNTIDDLLNELGKSDSARLAKLIRDNLLRLSQGVSATAWCIHLHRDEIDGGYFYHKAGVSQDLINQSWKFCPECGIVKPENA